MTTQLLPLVLILGANGRFGLAAAKAFLAAGWSVIGQLRRDAAPGLPAAVARLRLPLYRVAGALAGRRVAVVVHAVNPLYTRWEREAMPLALQGMAIAEALGARFMLPGNVYAFGAGMPALIDEATPPAPTTPKGRLRAALEDELARRAAAGRLTATVVTAGDFFGEGRGSWFDEVVVQHLARGRIDYPGDPGLVHAWAYLPDLARAFAALAGTTAAAPFERFTFAGHSVAGDAFVAAVERAAEAIGLARPRRGWRHGRTPWPLLRAAGLVVPMLRELATMSYLWRVPHALSGAKLQARCPQLASTPLDAALRESLLALSFAGHVHDSPRRLRADARAETSPRVGGASADSATPAAPAAPAAARASAARPAS